MTTDMKLSVIERYDCLIQIKAAVDDQFLADDHSYQNEPRSKMMQKKRFEALSLVAVESELINTLDSDEIVDDSA